jgi:uridine phosphorylase
VSREGKTHLGLRTAKAPETMLIAGDPARVRQMGSMWDSCETIGDNRGYLCLRGSYRGMEMGACSTGIGGPSCEVAIVELMQHGARSIIRVGTCGGIAPCVEPGDLIVLSACVRYSGAADAYVPPNYPAVADWEYVSALAAACRAREFKHHVGLGVTVVTFYGTKPWLIGPDPPKTETDGMIARWAQLGVLAMEMEAATLMVVGSLIGLRTAAICTAGSNVARGVRPECPPADANAIAAAMDAALAMERARRGGCTDLGK